MIYNICQDDDLIKRLNSNISPIPIFQSLSPVSRIERSLSLLKATVGKALYGGLEPAIHVMSAVPGIGKTTSIAGILAEAKTGGFPDGCSAVIFINMLAEGQAYVSAAGLDKCDYAYHTSDQTYTRYGAGRDAADRVPVLFVAHSKARRVLGGLDSFNLAEQFHYHGKPRSLRIWDEAFSPAEYAALKLNDLRMLPGALHGLGAADIAVFERLLPDKDELVAGRTIAIPSAVRGIADRVGMAGKRVAERAGVAIDAVSKLAGSTATLRKGKDGSWALVGIGRAMPADIAPMIVLDGSAALTGRYGDWSAYGMQVKHLEPAVIDYSPLTIHWWNRACGSTELSKPEGKHTVYSGIATVVNAKPEERFLIVMKKAFCTFDADGNPVVPPELAKLINDIRRIRVITWGRHLATNEYRDFENVILLGAYEYDESAYDAIASASTGIIPAEVDLTARQQARDGEFMHNVRQAVCRVRVRQRNGSLSGEANAYLIMPDTDHRRGLVHRAFPGATVQAWQPIAPVKRLKRDLVLEQVLLALESKQSISFGEVIGTCGSKQKSYLTKVVKDGWFIDALKGHRIRMVGYSFSRFDRVALAG